MVRAGVVSPRRMLLYGASAFVLVVAFGAAVGAVFGAHRIVTGLCVGSVASVALLVILFRRDGVELSETSIRRRTPWSDAEVGWDRVVAARFALDERRRWSLALDLDGDSADEPHGELVLVSMPPVTGPVSGAYDLQHREKVTRIRELLRRKKIPVSVLPEIADALSAHWQIAPPTR